MTINAAPVPATAERDLFPGSSAMADLMRRTDWARTPIGPPDRWPDSLKTAVGMCLESRFPIVLWWGPKLTLLYNDAYLPILGDKHPASLGQRGAQTWAEIWPTIGPMLDGVVRRGQATWSDDLLLYIRRRGFVEEGYFTFSYSPIRDGDGRVGGVFCAVNETTDRVRSERRLALLRDLSAAVPHDPTDAARLAIETIATAERDVTLAALYLRDENGFLQSPVVAARSVPATLLATLEREVAATALSASARWLVVPDSGTPAGASDGTVEVRIIPMPDPSGATADVLVLGRNPSIARDDVYQAFFDLVATHVATLLAATRARDAERRRADALAELDRAKTVFFTNVSHEFRTPLTLLDAPLRELADDPGLQPEHVERVEIGRRAAGRLRRLVNTLLEFSRIEAGTSLAQLEPVDVYDAAADIASVFRSAFDRAGLSLEVRGGPLERPVLADAEMLERILLNLVSNALKFTRTGGVVVEVGSAGGEAVVTVRDTGVGIADADLARIFDRFARVESSWARSREGSGIGLALAFELARLQGGRLEAESTPGAGSAFRLALPLADARAVRPTVPSQDRAAFADEASAWVHAPTPRDGDGEHGGPAPGDGDANATSRLGRAPDERAAGDSPATDGRGVSELAIPAPDTARILVVDDNADMSTYLAKILRRHWIVENEFDGLSGLARIQRDPPDLVLADVMMPGIDGIELVRRIRSEARLATLPVVLLSARAGEEARFEGLGAGADEYLVKPFTAADLVVRISAMLERERVRRAEAEALRASENRLRTAIGRLEHNEQKLSTALRVKDDFLGMVSHELRTPVTTIRGNAELLLTRRHRLDARHRVEALQDIAAEADRLDRVIANLLMLAKAGSDRLEQEPVLVRRLVDSIVVDAGRQAPDRQIAVHCPDDLMADANAGAVEQILKNLLSNAMKYSPAVEPIDVRCERDSGRIRISVIDRGAGLDAREIERVFDPFYRSDRTRHVSGIGIGLTVARRLAEAVGGNLTVESPGDGSTFTLTLGELVEPAEAAEELVIETAFATVPAAASEATATG